MSALAPYQQRVIDERDELEVKLDALTAFINGPMVKEITVADLELLRRQRYAMRDYSRILASRIERFRP